MEPELLITAILIGFGFGNIFLCLLVAFGSTVGQGWKIGAAFIGGRFLGIMALGLFIALFGWWVDINPSLMLLIFAIMSLAFGALVIMWPRGLAKLRLIRHCEAGGCEGCEENANSSMGNDEHNCNSCSSIECVKRTSISQNPKKAGRKKLYDHILKTPGLSITSIAFLGIVRGTTPCLKILLLVPLILTLPFYESMAITAVFALSSSIYTIIGIMAGSLLGAAFSEKRVPQLRLAGAVMMMGLGIYYMYKFWTFSCPGGI